MDRKSRLTDRCTVYVTCQTVVFARMKQCLLVGCLTLFLFIAESDGGTVSPSVRCPKLKVDHGKVSEDKLEYLPGDYEKVSCDYGYRQIGKGRLKCYDNGTWSTNPPYCEAVTCQGPLKPMNGTVQVTKPAKIGAVAEFRCDKHFILVGRSSLECGPDGKWMPEVSPRCKEVVCPNLPRVEGLRQKNEASVGGYVEMECEKTGTTLEGKAILFCDENGTWVPNALPHCERIHDDTCKETTKFKILFGVVCGAFGIVFLVAIFCLVYKRCMRNRQPGKRKKTSSIPLERKPVPKEDEEDQNTPMHPEPTGDSGTDETGDRAFS